MFALVIAIALAMGTHNTAQPKEPAMIHETTQKIVHVQVDGNGFTPAEIKVVKGVPTTLVFTRTSDATCARAVAFPQLGINKDLPLNEAVSLDVPVSETRTLAFQCGMGMFKSKVVVQ